MILEQFLNYKYNWFNCKISLLLYSCSATHLRSYSYALQDHCHCSCLLIPQEKIFFNVLCVKIALFTVFFSGSVCSCKLENLPSSPCFAKSLNVNKQSLWFLLNVRCWTLSGADWQHNLKWEIAKFKVRILNHISFNPL